MSFLSSSDIRCRLAAILICDYVWNAVADYRVVAACRTIAAFTESDPERIVAIGALARGLSGSRDVDASRMLAQLVSDSHKSVELRMEAYWALRQVRFGAADCDFDSFLRGTIHTVKAVMRSHPESFSEEAVKSALLANGRSPDDFWNDGVEQIDWALIQEMHELGEERGTH